MDFGVVAFYFLFFQFFGWIDFVVVWLFQQLSSDLLRTFVRSFTTLFVTITRESVRSDH